MDAQVKREKYKLTVIINSQPHSGQTAGLYWYQMIQMYVSNLRNRPLSVGNISALAKSMPKLYSRFTGEPESIFMNQQALFNFTQLASPFVSPDRDQDLNTPPCPPIEAPPAVTMSTADSLVTPVHPDKVDFETLRADPRNELYPMQWGGVRFTRVISPLYCTRRGELVGKWRVTDYTPEGNMMLSAFCTFPGATYLRTYHRMPHSQGKRKRGKSGDQSSTLPPAKRPLRL